MRPKTLTLTLYNHDSSDPTTVATDQQTAGAGSLTLDGSLASGGTVTLATAHKLDIESAANLSGVVFTVTGEYNGKALTEDITGPNATTVVSTYYYDYISDISVDGAVGSDVSVGVSDEAASPIYPLDHTARDFSVSFDVDITGTVNYSVQHTLSDVYDLGITALQWLNHDIVVSKTTDQDGNYVNPVYAMRVILNSYTFSGGAAVLHIIQGNS